MPNPSIFAMHATPNALAAYNKTTRFIVENNYLEGDYNEEQFLNLLGRFVCQLRKDSGGKRTNPRDVLGLTYITLPDLTKHGIHHRW